MRQLALTGALLLAAAGIVTADLGTPPEWRGDPGTVWGEWDTWAGFPGDALAPMLPDAWGTVVAKDYFPISQVGAGFDGVPLNSSVLPLHAGRTDVLSVGDGDSFVVGLENYESATPYTQLSLQVTYDSSAAGLAGLDVLSLYLGGQDMLHIEATSATLTALEGDWVTGIYDFQLAPCPYNEYLFIAFGPGTAYIDSVMIDTRVVVPEPVSVALMATIAAGAVLKIRRRRKS